MTDSFWVTLKDLNIELNLTIYPAVNEEKIKKIVSNKGIPISIFSNRNKKDTWRTFLLEENGKNGNIKFYKCGEHNCWQLYDNKLYPCPSAAYSHVLNTKFGASFSLKNSDFIDLDKKIKKLQLLKFSLSPKPFCRYCVLPRQFTDWDFTDKLKKEWIK